MIDRRNLAKVSDSLATINDALISHEPEFILVLAHQNFLAVNRKALNGTNCPDMSIWSLYNSNVKSKVVRLFSAVRRPYARKSIWTSHIRLAYTMVAFLSINYLSSLVRSRLCVALPA